MSYVIVLTLNNVYHVMACLYLAGIQPYPLIHRPTHQTTPHNLLFSPILAVLSSQLPLLQCLVWLTQHFFFCCVLTLPPYTPTTLSPESSKTQIWLVNNQFQPKQTHSPILTLLLLIHFEFSHLFYSLLTLHHNTLRFGLVFKFNLLHCKTISYPFFLIPS
jgi:hypothetical protein